MSAVFKRTLMAMAAAFAGLFLCAASASAQDAAITCRSGAPYDYSTLQPNVRTAIEQARLAQTLAREAAQRARAGNGGVVYDYAPDGPQYVGYLYEGEWSDGTRNGHGRFLASPPSSYAGTGYEGTWQLGTYNGSGVMMFSNGSRYEGSVANGAMSGFGVLWDAGGNVAYSGAWRGELDVDPLLTACRPAAPGK